MKNKYILILFAFIIFTSFSVHSSPWKKHIIGNGEDMWVLIQKPNIETNGIVYAPFFDVNQGNKLSDYSDPFGNKFKFDATIRHVYMNCKTRQMMLSSTEYYKDNALIFTEDNKFKSDLLSSKLERNTLWSGVSFGSFYGKSFEYYCSSR
ncbi:hypothetical protein GWI68_00185 [Proteus sp. G2669]|uniref:hypothetical protein n=1 Tax=Proteus sp. G2669 TaxID=2698881 RepID=UPI00141218FE|nr:hypothetical protein [Proteus sp. G2669]NBM53217.1 hypothetical protein [Proteus sp. G2669]